MIIGRVYQLVNAKTKIPFYVGSTLFDLQLRLAIHNNCIKNGNNALVYKQCRKMKIKVEIQLLDFIVAPTITHLRNQESKWISALTETGIELWNTRFFDEIEIEYSQPEECYNHDYIVVSKNVGYPITLKCVVCNFVKTITKQTTLTN